MFDIWPEIPTNSNARGKNEDEDEESSSQESGGESIGIGTNSEEMSQPPPKEENMPMEKLQAEGDKIFDQGVVPAFILAMRNLRYVVDKSGGPNLIGVRTGINSNKFDDIIALVWKNEQDQWQQSVFPATTDAGKNVMSLDHANDASSKREGIPGAAVLIPGQYLNTFCRGLHKTYSALVQRNEVRLWRYTTSEGATKGHYLLKDDNCVERFDSEEKDAKICQRKVFIGKNFGINIHKSGAREEGSTIVNNWSHGCQVFSKETDFNKVMQVVTKALEQKDTKDSSRSCFHCMTYTLLLASEVPEQPITSIVDKDYLTKFSLIFGPQSPSPPDAGTTITRANEFPDDKKNCDKMLIVEKDVVPFGPIFNSD